MTATINKKQQALEKLTAGIKALLESGDWEKYLKTQARFHNYSAANCFLILCQCPHATQVAGFQAWKKLKRYVKKGEKAISILAPIRRKVENEETGETKYIISGFRSVNVFDLSQTEGEPLPEVISALEGDDFQTLLSCMIDFAQKEKGITVTFNLCEGGGYCQYDKEGKAKLINLNPKRSPNHQAKTMAHELAHALLHNPKEYLAHRGDNELEAESTAFVVLDHFGFDTSGYSFGYITHWQSEKDQAEIIDQISNSAAAIHSASATIIEAIGKK